MLVGHYSAAFAAKAMAPRVPLWTLFLAVQFVDILWALFILVGIENARLDPSLASNALDLYDMPYTHSLLATVLWAAVAGGLGWALFRKRGEGWVIALAVTACVVSHWVLDYLVHRPDLIVFENDPRFKVGLGLWDWPLLALALELVLFVGSVLWLWLTLPQARSRALAIFAGVLTVAQIGIGFGPHPTSVSIIAAIALATFLGLTYAAFRLDK